MIDYVYTDKPTEQATDSVVKAIKNHLSKGERVLWLLSGGSSIAIAVEASKRLKLSNLSNLFVSLVDERYGLIGHQDENWQQLIDAGFNLPSANLYRPLIGKDIEPTRAGFNDWLSDQITMADYKIGIFGIGIDGHTAGIKPHSSAVLSANLVAFFKGDDFPRLTITFLAIKQLDEAIVLALGKDKISVIQSLLNNNLPLDEQPSQILKSIPCVTLYTNNNKEKI